MRSATGSSALVVALLSSAAVASVAGAVTVNFEELGVQPASFDLTKALRTEYFGLTFAGPDANDGGAILNKFGNFGFDPRSGDNFLAFNNKIDQDIMTDGGRPEDPETIIFSELVSDVEIWANGFACEFRMDVLNVAGGIIGSVEVDADGEWVKLSFASNTPIQAIVLTETTGDQAFCFDDLNYTPVPTPGALGMLAVGGLLTARRRR